MPNILSFSEDMLPRHFPKAKKQFERVPIDMPKQSTLPPVSLMFTDGNNIPKIGIKKSFEKWKKQHEAIFTNNSTEHQIKLEKKQVRFQTENDHYYSKRRSLPNQRTEPLVCSNLELSYSESPNSQMNKDYYHQQVQQQFHQSQQHSNKSKYFSPKTTSTYRYVNSGLNGLRKNLNFGQSLQSLKETGLPQSIAVDHKNQRQFHSTDSYWSASNRHCCQKNLQSTDTHFCPQDGQQGQPIKESSSQRNDVISINILEEQQQHILFQQNQILMHEKHNLEQQTQIYILQKRIQQLLFLNDAKRSPSVNPNEMTTGILNAVKLKNGSTTTMDSSSSIGVLSTLIDNVDAIYRFKDINLTTLGTEKLFSTIGASDEYSSDVLLDETIRNSSAMVDYSINGPVSPNHSNTNITSQTLTYEALSTNSTYKNAEKVTDRSFALNMLGMKYNCGQDDDQRGAMCNNQSNSKSNDQIFENVPSDTNDYLIRHGLLKRLI